MSSAANVLTSSQRFYMWIRETFFDSIDFEVINEYDKGAFKSAYAPLLYCFSKCPLKRDFLDIYQVTFWESLISKFQNLWGSSFLTKYLKLNLDFKNAAKDWKKKCFFPQLIASRLTTMILIDTSEYDKGAVMQIWTVLWHVYYVACGRVVSNGTFQAFI